MILKTTHVPLVVQDQDRALAFYVDKLGFEKRQDYGQKGRPRWLTVAPPGSDVEFALVRGEYETDPRGADGFRWTLTTEDCRADVAALKARGVAFEGKAPAEMPFGLLATFADPDGNRFNLLQPKRA